MRKRDEIQAEYFQWLCNIVQADDQDHSYMILMKTFHRFDFTWTIENDKNRAVDGLDLRREYAENFGCDDDFMGDVPCTFLEMLIGIALRMEFILFNPNFGNQTPIWFWILIENMELEDYTDDHYAEYPFFENDVRETISRIINRTYCRNSSGSLFPVRKNRKGKNWRTTELWYQLNAFLVENYDDYQITF